MIPSRLAGYIHPCVGAAIRITASSLLPRNAVSEGALKVTECVCVRACVRVCMCGAWHYIQLGFGSRLIRLSGADHHIHALTPLGCSPMKQFHICSLHGCHGHVIND